MNQPNITGGRPQTRAEAKRAREEDAERRIKERNRERLEREREESKRRRALHRQASTKVRIRRPSTRFRPNGDHVTWTVTPDAHNVLVLTRYDADGNPVNILVESTESMLAISYAINDCVRKLFAQTPWEISGGKQENNE